MEPGPQWLALVVGVPALIALAIVGVMSLPWNSPSRWRIEQGWILAIVVATWVGVFVGRYWPSSVWHESGPYLVAILPMLAMAAIVFASPKVRRPMAWGLRGAALVAMSPVMLSFMWRNGTWGWPWETFAWLAGLGVAAVLITWGTTLLAERSPGRSIPFAIGLVCACTGATIVMSGGISTGSMALSLGAAIAGGLVGSSRVPKVISCKGSVGMSVGALVGLLIFARFTQLDTPAISLYLLALSPLTLWVSEIPFVSRLKGWQVVAIRMVAIMIPLSVAVTPVAVGFVRAIGSGDY